MNSILNSVKRLLGVNPEYTFFDEELIIHINSVLMILAQLGIGPNEGFVIHDASETWDQFLGDKTDMVELVKSYIYLKVKVVWDSGLTSATLNSIIETIKEYEWRLNVRVESEVGNNE